MSKFNNLIDYMMEVPDPRASYNQRHNFIDILMISLLGTLCGF